MPFIRSNTKLRKNMDEINIMGKFYNVKLTYDEIIKMRPSLTDYFEFQALLDEVDRNNPSYSYIDGIMEFFIKSKQFRLLLFKNLPFTLDKFEETKTILQQKIPMFWLRHIIEFKKILECHLSYDRFSAWETRKSEETMFKCLKYQYIKWCNGGEAPGWRSYSMKFKAAEKDIFEIAMALKRYELENHRIIESQPPDYDYSMDYSMN